MGSKINGLYDKSRKISPRNTVPQDSETEQLQQFFTSAVQWLDLFIAQAASVDAGTAARILHNAKEELVYWAVSMNFHETAQDKFINRAMFNNAMFAAADFISRFDAVKDKEQFLKGLQKGSPDPHPFDGLRK